MRVQRTCERCGTLFQTTEYRVTQGKGRFCSVACYRPPIERICARCGKPFTCRPSEADSARFCSMACYKPPRPLAICARCGREYYRRPCRPGEFCSAACASQQVTKVCVGCGKTFRVMPSKDASYQFCSLVCKQAHPALPSKTLTCGWCKTTFTAKTRRIYCSRACQRAAHAIQYTTITCAYCGQPKTLEASRVARENTRYCSPRCGTLARVEAGFAPGYLGNKIRTGYRTDIEALTETVLQDLGITYQFEHKIGRYCVDFALPHLGIALECDGWQHRKPDIQERDRQRDQAIADRGWRVVRMPDQAIRANARAAVLLALEMEAPDAAGL